ncbi:hypothetical protein PpBr36_05510 [Pyricularia pennisetigena]|uniref:hypothetical protein n=1 Tax=Pyricularia pennisetigena TaxID=1578925 RepID=UPI00115343C0|nr:hypothetical protein PpBr36_05510 [Pyricularia pennisetigena]TLS26461.1 hypothetical protein PpBr36_05510 [Pyricularia pennisetigena]
MQFGPALATAAACLVGSSFAWVMRVVDVDSSHNPRIDACKVTMSKGDFSITKYTKASDGLSRIFVTVDQRCVVGEIGHNPKGFNFDAKPIQWVDDPSPQQITQRIRKLNKEGATP